MYKNETGYPSVTQILKPWIDDEWYTEESRQRGSAVHYAIDAYLNCVYQAPLKQEYQGYLDSFKKWFDSVAEIESTEQRLVDSVLGFCGKYDLLFKFTCSPQVLVLGDIKTSLSEQPWWGYQLSAYSHLIMKNMKKYAAKRIAIRPKKDGKGCIITEYSSDNDWIIFNNALILYRNMKGSK
jgi:hypothetical protein